MCVNYLFLANWYKKEKEKRKMKHVDAILYDVMYFKFLEMVSPPIIVDYNLSYMASHNKCIINKCVVYLVVYVQ